MMRSENEVKIKGWTQIVIEERGPFDQEYELVRQVC